MVIHIDRGHYRIRLDGPGLIEDSSGDITAMKAREPGRGRVIIGDRVAVVGDTNGRKGTLAHMAHIEECTTLLCHSAEDGDAVGTEKPIVASAAKFAVVTATVDPESCSRTIDRCLAATCDVDMEPLVAFTRSDLADVAPLTGPYSPSGARRPAIRLSPRGPETGPSQVNDEQPGDGVEAARQVLGGTVSAFAGHSGTGKSTPTNTLVPGVDHATGYVSEVIGRGRHTSTSPQALELSGGGWVTDAPGVCSLGTSHIGSVDVLRDFPNLARMAKNCPCGRTHEDGVIDCALNGWVSATDGPDASRASTVCEERRARVESFRRLLAPSPEAKGPTHP